MIYFSLANHIYAARYDNAIIILDSAHDKYVSIIDNAAQYFQIMLESSFERDNDGKFVIVPHISDHDSFELNYWIFHFIEKQFIVETDQLSRKSMAPLSLRSGGLIEYRWDYKPSWKPFAQVSKWQIVKALFTLVRVHYLLKRKGIKGILEAIKKSAAKNATHCQPTDQAISKLAAVVDAASLLYPKKTYCLAWASTFVLLAINKNWSCNLVIGIETNPFYAHAWAQMSEKVIHDDPVIAKVLSIILKEPTI